MDVTKNFNSRFQIRDEIIIKHTKLTRNFVTVKAHSVEKELLSSLQRDSDQKAKIDFLSVSQRFTQLLRNEITGKLQFFFRSPT